VTTKYFAHGATQRECAALANAFLLLLGGGCGAQVVDQDGNNLFATKCTHSSDCDEQSVCVSSACEPAGGRRYRFTFINATVPDLDPSDGLAWDALGGAPDPYACLAVDNAAIGCTTAAQDTYRPTWNQAFEAVVQASSRIDVTISDEDATTPDAIDSFYIDPPVWMLHAGGIDGPTHDGSKTSLHLSVTPR